MKNSKRQILSYILDKCKDRSAIITVDSLIKEFRYSRNTTESAINFLVESGKIVRTGEAVYSKPLSLEEENMKLKQRLKKAADVYREQKEEINKLKSEATRNRKDSAYEKLVSVCNWQKVIAYHGYMKISEAYKVNGSIPDDMKCICEIVVENMAFVMSNINSYANDMRNWVRGNIYNNFDIKHPASQFWVEIMDKAGINIVEDEKGSYICAQIKPINEEPIMIAV